MDTMKIAIPMAEGRLTTHFGHCASFALISVDTVAKSIVNKEEVQAPPHEPGLLPVWLHEKQVSLIIAGGMGSRAQTLFEQKGIQVITGAPCLDPETLVTQYMNNTLETGDNGCSH